MSDEPRKPLPDFSPPSTSSAPSINRATFCIQPGWAIATLLRRNAHATSWRVIAGGLIEFDVRGEPADLLIPTHCTVVVSPQALVEKLLPPGNAIRECWAADDGSLEFVFEGIDAPPSPDGKLPKMRLLLQQDAMGQRSTWLETMPPAAGAKRDDDLLAKLRDRLNKHPGKDAA